MDVLIVRLNLKLRMVSDTEGRSGEDPKSNLATFPFLVNRRKTLDDLRLLFLGQDANESQCLGICDRAADICGVHPLVVSQ
jgi:hypothetical protein